MYKRLGRWKIHDMAHDAAWKKTGRNATIDILDIAKAVSDGDMLAKHLQARFS
jgi:hypothetical protein